MSEALQRLKDAVKDKKVVHERTPKMVRASHAHVSANDVLDVASAIATRTDKVSVLMRGCMGAREHDWVHITVLDLSHLIAEAEKQ